MATRKKAAPKPKKKIAKEDIDVAKNLGVDVSEDVQPVKVDRKKFRAVKEAAEIGGALGAEDRDAVQEKRRYHATLAQGAILNGVTAADVNQDRSERRDAAAANEQAGTDEYLRYQSALAASEPKGAELTPDELSRRYSDQGKFPVGSARGTDVSQQIQDAMKESGQKRLGTPIIDDITETPESTNEEREARALQTAARFERIHKAAVDASQRHSSANVRIAEEQKRRASLGLPVQGDLGAATGASLSPLPRQEAPTYQQTLAEGTQERRASKLEKAKPVIAKATGKNIDDIGYAGDEEYVVDEDSGRTDSINAHALRMAQRDWDKSKLTGRDVNGIGSTRKRSAIVNGKETLVDESRPRPEKIEDIYDTPHRGIAFQARHLGLTEEQILGASSNQRRSYESKANTLMEVAKEKAGSMRKINVANEVQSHHKGWEDQNGNLHKFVFEKGGQVSPMSLPSEFTRTATPINAVADPEYDTENLMGASQVEDNDVDRASSTKMKPGKPIAGGLEYGERAGLQGAVSSHEGWTLHTDDVWRKIAHPIPEQARIHVADKVAGRVILEQESRAKKSSSKGQRALMKSVAGEDAPIDRTNTGGRGGDKNLAPFHTVAGPAYDAMTPADFDPETTTNPRPPAISTSVLVSNRGKNAGFDDIREALASKKIKPEQASALNPNWDSENNKVVIPQTGEKSRLDMTRSEKIADTKKRKSAMDEAKAKAAKQPTAAQYRSKQFVQARPLSLSTDDLVERGQYNMDRGDRDEAKGRVLSSAYTKAATDIASERNFRGHERGETELVGGVYPGFEDLGYSLKREKTTGPRTTRVMSDDRGPVKEGEIVHRMVQSAVTSQALPERDDVRDALKDGHISSEEAKNLRTLDQFSKYRTQTAAGPVPQAKDMSDIKYSRLYEPVTAREASVERPGHKTPITEGEAAVAPSRTRRKKAAATAQKVSSQLRSYIGSYADINAGDLPKIRGQQGSVREGSAREFGNWKNQPDVVHQYNFKPGDMISHSTHGVGRVSRILEAGSILPGTETTSRSGKLKKGTGTQITERHAEINFGSGNIKHLPLTENLSSRQREAVSEVTPASTPGFGGDIKTRGRLGQKATEMPMKVAPSMQLLKETDLK